MRTYCTFVKVFFAFQDVLGKRAKNFDLEPVKGGDNLNGSFLHPAARRALTSTTTTALKRHPAREFHRCYSEADVGRAKESFDQHDLIGDYSKVRLYIVADNAFLLN